jgi:lipid-A-disaccharide synthase
MIVAGEASGDLHGARLVTAMLKREPSLHFVGVGGRELRKAGVRIFVEASALAVVGITEVFSKGRLLLKGFAKAVELIKVFNPDLLILIDFPDFNLRLAAKARKLRIPVLYYISPQIWAWRKGRIRKIKRRIDHVAVILPFEEKFYRDKGVPATFVGHPLLDDRDLDPETEFPGKNQRAIVGLLPGSRDKEVTRHLPVMLAAAARLQKRFSHIRFVVSQAPTVDPLLLESILKKYEGSVALTRIREPVAAIFRQSLLVVAVSGTVTLEAALSGVPAVIVYRVSPLSYWLGKALIRVEHIGLVNLIAGKTVVPELIQREVTAEKIAAQVINMIDNPERLNQMRSELVRARQRMGEAGASDRVAEIALSLMSSDAESESK